MKLLFVLIFSLFSFILVSQNTEDIYTVSGVINDAETHLPLQYITVTLQEINSKEITAEITNKEGGFLIEIPKGKYYFISESISFKPFIIQTLNIDQDIDLGSIELNQNFERLEEVEIIAKNNLVDYKYDKKIYNASKDIANAGGNAITVLENTPSVLIDEDGNISLRGSQVKVLVNGLTYGGQQSNADVLSLIPANSISKVEIISNSAKYDAEGGGGILNIILKRGTNEGYNGTIEAHGGSPDNDGISTFINYKTEKINIFSTASFNHLVKIKDIEIDQVFLNNSGKPTGSFDEERFDNLQRNNLLINIGSEFYLDNKNTFTTSLLYTNSNKNYNSDLIINDYKPIDKLFNSSLREVEENTDEEFIEAFVNYVANFNDKGHQLSVNLNYNKGTSNNLTAIFNEETFPGSGLTDQKYSKIEGLDNYYLKLDYSLPLKNNALLEVGHKTNIRIYENDFILSKLNTKSGVYESNTDFSNHILYDENIYSFYVNFSKEYEKISYALGLRTEISNTEISDKSSNDELINNYTDLFPYALISYTFENNSFFSFSYSRSLERPTISQLNPFNSFTDERFIRMGNPYLTPSYSNLFLVEYNHDFESLSLNTGIYYSRSTDKISNILEETGFQTDDGFNIYRVLPINNGNASYTGFELSLTYNPNKKIRLLGFFGPYYTELTETTNNEYDFNDFTWFGKFSALYRFNETFRFQINGYYHPRTKTAISELKTIKYINLSISKELFDRKSTLTFKINDVLHSKEYVYNSQEANALSNRVAIYDTQYLLSFTYRFNKSSKRSSHNRTKDLDKNIFEIKEDIN